MAKPHIAVIAFRYFIVGCLFFGIWIGSQLAFKITLSLVIIHSELLYILERLKEKDVDYARKKVQI